MNNIMSETKITTKEGMLKFLEAVSANVSDNLKERINYTLDVAVKNIKKVTKTDLLDLVSEAKKELLQSMIEDEMQETDEEEFIQPELDVVNTKVENQTKPLPNEKPAVKDKENDKAPKSADKKPKLKSKVEETNPLSSKSFPMAKFFPEEIDHEDLGKLKAVPTKYTTYKELYKALDDGKTLYFACYWSARQIKEFDYSGTRLVPAPAKFPNDLDLLVAVVPCEKIERVWCMSQYTEAMFMFDGDALMPIEDKDPVSKETFKIRVSHGLEFEIYESLED